MGACGVYFVGCHGYRLDEGAAWTFPLLGCVTGLPKCGLEWGCILVCGSDLRGTGGGFLLYFIFEDSCVLAGPPVPVAGYSQVAQVVLSRCTAE